MSNTSSNAADTRLEAVWRPAIDVFENSEGITVYADLPGVSKDRLNIHVEGDTLQIEGNLGSQSVGGTQAHYTEMRCQGFRRAFTLSRELDSGNIEAELRDGLLTLHVPKRETAKPRRIDVAVA